MTSTTSIKNLARLVHSVNSKDKFLAMFIAHYDWSGQYHSPDKVEFDGPILSLGGFVASEEQWDEFEIKWREALEKKNIKVLHVTDFGKLSKNWDEIERDEFLDQLTEIIRNLNGFGVWATIFSEQYVNIVEPLVPTKTGKWLHGPFKKSRMPYLFLLWFCLMWMRDHFPIPEGEKISIIYEEDQRLEHALATFSRELITMFGWTDRYELPVNFRKKGDPHALESADILAFLARERASRKFIGGPFRTWGKRFQLGYLGRIGGGHMDEETVEGFRKIYEDDTP